MRCVETSLTVSFLGGVGADKNGHPRLGEVLVGTTPGTKVPLRR